MIYARVLFTYLSHFSWGCPLFITRTDTKEYALKIIYARVLFTYLSHFSWGCPLFITSTDTKEYALKMIYSRVVYCIHIYPTSRDAVPCLLPGRTLRSTPSRWSRGRDSPCQPAEKLPCLGRYRLVSVESLTKLWIFVLNLLPFASNLSYPYLCGSNLDPDPKHGSNYNFLIYLFVYF